MDRYFTSGRDVQISDANNYNCGVALSYQLCMQTQQQPHSLAPFRA